MKKLTDHILSARSFSGDDWNVLMASFCDDEIDAREKAFAFESLCALEITGENLAAAASYLLDNAVLFDAGNGGALDICGTGGDKSVTGVKTFNISTAVAFVLAAAKVPVIKHGNRAVSSDSGSADVLSALHVRAAESAVAAKADFDRHGICFVLAPAFHPALKSVSAARKAYGKPTFFNLLGPLCNPARLDHQLIGVYDSRFLEPVAAAAKILGKQRVLVVSGEDGLDEISLSGPTNICSLENGELLMLKVTPEEAGLRRADNILLSGGSPVHNAGIIESIFKGEEGAPADIVCLNAAAGLLISRQAENLAQGVALARAAIQSGAALAKLHEMRQGAAS